MKPASRLWQGRNWVADVLVVAFLLLLCYFFFWQILTPNPLNRRWFARGDFTDQFYAFRYFLSNELWSGRLPLWNPHTFSGVPFLADVQAAVYYPLGLLIILLAGKGGLPLVAVEIEVIIHYFLASLFVYLFVKQVTGRRLAGLASGIVYTYGSYLTSYPKLQMAILEGQTWVPLALLAIHLAAGEERQAKRQRSIAWLACGGLALGLTALAGHGQTLLLAAYAVMAYLAFEFAPLWWSAGTRRKSELTAQVLVLPLVALGLGAAQLIPSIEYTQLSSRAQMSFAEAGGGYANSDILALLLPGFRLIYVGVLPLILAILALVLKRIREAVFWGIVALLALLLSLGEGSALNTFLYVFAPGFNLFRGQERSMQVFSLAAAILAGYGTAVLDQPMARKVKHRYASFFRLVLWANAAAVVLALLAFLMVSTVAPPEPGTVNDLLERSVLLAILLGLSTLALYLRLGHKLRGWRLAILILPIIIFDLFTVNYGHHSGGGRARDRFVVTPLVEFLQGQPTPFRVQDDHLLPGNYGCVWGLEAMGGISPLRLQSYRALLDTLTEERARSLLNVAYVISESTELPDGELLGEYSARGKELYLHRVTDVGPRAYLVYSAEVKADEGAALQRLASPEFDHRETVILADEPGLALPGSGDGRVRFVERQPTRLSLEVDSDSDGILVLSEIYYPGWQATVDGREVPILRANTVLRAVPITAGTHRVGMIFRPWTLSAGLGLSALTLTVLIGAVWLRRNGR
jgi:hypothetical protein